MIIIDHSVHKNMSLTPRPPRLDEAMSASTVLAIPECLFGGVLLRLLHIWPSVLVLSLIKNPKIPPGRVVIRSVVAKLQPL